MEYMDTAGAAAMLHLCEEQVRRLARSGMLSYHRPNGTRKFLFSKSDILDYISSGRVTSIQQLIHTR